MRGRISSAIVIVALGIGLFGCGNNHGQERPNPFAGPGQPPPPPPPPPTPTGSGSLGGCAQTFVVPPATAIQNPTILVQPGQTLGAALASAVPGDVVAMPMGMVANTASGERFPIVVPRGVTLDSVGPGGGAFNLQTGQWQQNAPSVPGQWARIEGDGRVPAVVAETESVIVGIAINNRLAPAIAVDQVTDVRILWCAIEGMSRIEITGSERIVVGATKVVHDLGSGSDGIFVENSEHVVIQNCTIVRASRGVDIMDSSVLVRDSIIAMSTGSGLIMNAGALQRSCVEYTDVWSESGSRAVDMLGLPVMLPATTLDANPAFWNRRTGDLTLLPWSPCMDAGSSGFAIGGGGSAMPLWRGGTPTAWLVYAFTTPPPREEIMRFVVASPAFDTIPQGGLMYFRAMEAVATPITVVLYDETGRDIGTVRVTQQGVFTLQTTSAVTLTPAGSEFSLRLDRATPSGTRVPHTRFLSHEWAAQGSTWSPIDDGVTPFQNSGRIEHVGFTYN